MSSNDFDIRGEKLAQRWTPVWFMLLGAAVTLAVGLWTNFEQGRAAGIATGILTIAMIMFWDLRRHYWFWIVMTVFVAAHVILVIVVPWPKGSFSGPLLWPIAFVDLVTVYLCIKFVQRLTKKIGGNL